MTTVRRLIFTQVDVAPLFVTEEHRMRTVRTVVSPLLSETCRARKQPRWAGGRGQTANVNLHPARGWHDTNLAHSGRPDDLRAVFGRLIGRLESTNAVLP